MHTAMLLITGVSALLVFIFFAVVLKKSPATGARFFILPWLVASLVNFYIGTFRVGVPITVELPVLAVVFGVPAAIAWYVARRHA